MSSVIKPSRLPLLLLIALAIAMSPLFAEEAEAKGFVCAAKNPGAPTVLNKCFPDEAACTTACPETSTQVCLSDECTPGTTPKKIAGNPLSPDTSLFDITVGFVLKLLNYLLYGVSTVLERLVALSAFLLEMAIDVSSAPFSDVTILQNGWKIVRDVMNSFFVLFLFIIAIATILQLESYAWKSLLPTFIIVALLVNFSFVLSGVVIDFSNVLGRTFFDKMKPLSDNIAKAFDINNINNITLPTCQPSVTNPTTGTTGTIAAYAKGWSCASGATDAAQKLYLAYADIYNVATSDIDTLAKYLFVLTLRVIMLFLMIFPLLAGAALMIMRTVMLMVLIIFAPAAFTAYILPATRSYATQWWSELFSKSFFFPSYLFLLYIAINYGITIGNALKATGTQLGGTFENLATIFNFLTMVAFMFIALSVARNSGIKGAEVVMKYADASRKWAQGYAGRMTGVPRLAEKYSQSGTAQWLAARGPLLGGLAGRPLMKLAERGARAGGREEALKSRTDVITKLEPRFQGNAYLRAGAPVRKRYEEQMKPEGMAEMLHYTDDQKTRQKIRDAAFASQSSDQRGNSQERLKTAYADREINKQSTGQLVGRFDSTYYTKEEEEKIFDEAKTDKRAKVLMRSTRNIADLEQRMLDGIGRRDVREIERTYEEIARTSIDMNPDAFLQKFSQLSNIANKKLFDIINPRELERQMADFGVDVDPATGARTARALNVDENAFLSKMQPLGRNRNNIEVRKIVGAVRPKFYSELGYGTQEDLVRALTPAEAASMNEEDMKDAAISQHFDGGQLEAIARSQRVTPDTRRQVRDHVLTYSGSQRTLFGNQLYMTTITQAEYDRQINRLDRLEAYLNRSSAYQ